MREYKIYTCGKMSGLSYEEQTAWRFAIQEAISFRTQKNVTYIHPPLFYNYEHNFHKCEREVMEWEIKQVCESDVVIVNLDNVSSSVGSLMELGAICGANLVGNRKITLIGIGELSDSIHPWIELGMLRHENSIDDAADYIAKYLLV